MNRWKFLQSAGVLIMLDGEGMMGHSAQNERMKAASNYEGNRLTEFEGIQAAKRFLERLA